MRLFLAGSLLLFSVAGFGQAKRAQSLIEKQKYETAYELLINALEKDTTSASLPFVLAKLYLIQNWPQVNLDSAYYFSTESVRKYDLLDEKHLDKHIKEGFGKTRLLTIKKLIDSLAFEVTKMGGSESNFQQFIDVHIDASQLDSAIYYRNQQAYKTAASANTLKSYKLFLDTYPNAVDWQKADAQYQRILYKESTASGKLKAYRAFVIKYPKSPYVEEAINQIYKIKIGENTSSVLLDFINTYPTSKAAKKAIGLLYHSHLAQESASSFADKYPKINISDSLQRIIKNQKTTLLPIWSGAHFQLIDLSQNVVIDSLKGLDERTIDKDFLSVTTNKGQFLISKLGDPFYQGDSFAFDKESGGYVFLQTKDEVLIVHKNGQLINGGDEARIVEPFIGFKSNGKWGLKSITNIELLAPRYDSIWVENQLLFLSLKEKTIITTASHLYPALDQETVELEAPFDDYEWLTDELLWVERNGKEGLFSASLEELVAFNKQQIDLAAKGWTVTNKEGIRVSDFSSSILDSFNENEHWQIGRIKDSVIVRDRYNQLFSPTSAALLGPSAIIMHWADSGFVYLTDTIRFLKPTDCEVKPLLNEANEVDYYEVIEGKSKKLMNGVGQKIDLKKYVKVIPLSQSFFQLETTKSKRLYTSTGVLVLDKLEGSSLINDTTISILKDQHFGVIQPFDSVYIEPVFNKKLKPLADSLWAASVEDKLGVINAKSDTLLPFKFDEINYWANGLLLVKVDLKWNIFDLKVGKFVASGIATYASITKNGSPKITYQKGVGVGVFDSEKGIVLKPTYSNVYLEGTATESYYRAEKYVEEAGLHIMLYYNLEGELLFQNILSEAAFGLLYGTSEE